MLDRQIDTQIERQTDRQTDTHTHTHTQTHTHTHTHREREAYPNSDDLPGSREGVAISGKVEHCPPTK